MNTRTPAVKKFRIPIQKDAIGMQFSLAFCVFLLQAGLLMGIYAFIRKFFAELAQVSDSLALSSSHPFRSFVDYQRTSLLRDVFGYGAGLVILSTVLMFIFSFRFVGPIRRVISYLESVRKHGRAERPLSLRRGDFLTPVVNSLNAAIAAVEAKEKDSRP